jgi:hypothetical protein
MAIILMVALVIMFVALAKSKRKLRALAFIWGWTVTVSVVAGLATFFLAKAGRAGNPPALAGDITGASFTLTLLVSSTFRLRSGKQVQPADGSYSAMASREEAQQTRREGWPDDVHRS